MKDPAGKLSPVGGDFDTYEAFTHHTDTTILESHALLLHIVAVAAYINVVSGTTLFSGFLITVDVDPNMSAWTYRSYLSKYFFTTSSFYCTSLPLITT